MSPAARHERLQQAELGRRQRQRGVADACLVTARFEDQGARPRAARPPAARRARPIDAAHHRRDPGQQLGLAERLDEVVVGADAERPDLGRLGALARHDEDRRLARRRGSGRRR